MDEVQQSKAVAAGPSLLGYDFADFGCNDGGSIKWARQAFKGGTAVGIDKNADAVARARALGYDAVLADLTDFSVPADAFRFVMLSHFLEHLPTLAVAKKCMANAVRAAREFVVVRQPWFASDSYLAQLGLKQFWSDWTGHPNRMDLLDFALVLREIPKPWIWRVYGWRPIKDSDDRCIIPLAAPINSHDYEATEHGPKPTIQFSQAVFREAFCIAAIDKQTLAATQRAIGGLTGLLEGTRRIQARS